jgi:hypothetical protein
VVREVLEVMQLGRLATSASKTVQVILLAVFCMLLLPVCGCAKSVSSGTGAGVCTNPETTTRHELLFGLRRPDSSIISDEEFTVFLFEVITPRFPHGLTLIDAAGQYQLANGTRIDEPTKVLVLIYPDSQEVRAKIGEIVNHYRERFQQESVGWIRTAARACF